jgi:hypothetical protein
MCFIYHSSLNYPHMNLQYILLTTYIENGWTALKRSITIKKYIYIILFLNGEYNLSEIWGKKGDHSNCWE